MTSTDKPTWLSEVLAWLKHHWMILVVIAVGIWAWIVLRGKGEEVERMLSLYQRQSDDQKRQLDEIRRLREEERVKQAQIEQTYQETLETLRRNHQEQVRLLNASKKQEIRKIIEETNGGDPDLLAKRMNALFGIPIFEQPTQPEEDSDQP